MDYSQIHPGTLLIDNNKDTVACGLILSKNDTEIQIQWFEYSSYDLIIYKLNYAYKKHEDNLFSCYKIL